MAFDAAGAHQFRKAAQLRRLEANRVAEVEHLPLGPCALLLFKGPLMDSNRLAVKLVAGTEVSVE
jgi:hypothetical protein